MSAFNIATLNYIDEERRYKRSRGVINSKAGKVAVLPKLPYVYVNPISIRGVGRLMANHWLCLT